MPRIQRLPVDLANKIAAGEVVERPASVVKELVENALDAEATRIRVEIDMGGLARIQVTDDGCGMDAADLALALERHATSKIAHIDDLHRIGTFGFRGEALPSIASVAKVTVTSRARGSDEGTEIRVEGGAPPELAPVGAAVGTSVLVRDLFWNVPARLKFMKSTATESAAVSEAVIAAALARPEVAFTLARDGKVAREYLRASSRGERAAAVLADERLEACTGEVEGASFEAYLAPPERARAGAVGLHLFVNGRPVKDRLLARAIANAYGSVLDPGRYPIGVFFLELPPERVDVNVHPQKAEVRLSDGRRVLEAVTRALAGKLARAFSLPGGPSWTRPSPARLAWPSAGDGVPAGDFTDRGAPPWSPSTDGGRPITGASGAAYGQAASAVMPLRDAAGEGAAGPPDLFGPVGFYASLRFLGQARATFLVCEGDDALYVLDQHAAAERVNYERLRAAFRAGRVASQGLLVPEVVALSPADHALALEHADEALRLGLEVRDASGSSVSVHAVPRLLGRASPERLVRDLVSELGRHGDRPFGDAADLVLATMACHGSIRAGDRVTPDEVLALLEALDRVDFAGHCPHGRPVVMRLPYGELERRVGR